MGNSPAKEKADQTHKSATDENETPQTNTLNEMQILEGHSDIVRLLIKIDEFR
jgi:hypothetical protein